MSGATFDWTFPQAFAAGEPAITTVGRAVTAAEGQARADTAAGGLARAETAAEGVATADAYDS